MGNICLGKAVLEGNPPMIIMFSDIQIGGVLSPEYTPKMQPNAVRLSATLFGCTACMVLVTSMRC